MTHSSTRRRRKLNSYGRYLKANRTTQKKIYWKLRKKYSNHRTALGKTGKKMATLWRSSSKRRRRSKSSSSKKKRRSTRRRPSRTKSGRCPKDVVMTGVDKGKCRKNKKRRSSTRRPSRTKSGRCPKGQVKEGPDKGKCRRRRSSRR